MPIGMLPAMAEPRALEAEEWQLWDLWMRAQRLLMRELERGLQHDCGISKAEFSVLVTLRQATGDQMRVGELADALDWEKSRVSHLLTRMEGRALVTPVHGEGSARRLGVRLTAKGRDTAERAVERHGGNIRRHFLDALSPAQAEAVRSWSEQTVERLDPPPPPDDGAAR